MCLNLLKAANRLSTPVYTKKQPGYLIIGYPGRINGGFGTETAENLNLDFGCRVKGLFAKVSAGKVFSRQRFSAQ